MALPLGLLAPVLVTSESVSCTLAGGRYIRHLDVHVANNTSTAIVAMLEYFKSAEKVTSLKVTSMSC